MKGETNIKTEPLQIIFTDEGFYPDVRNDRFSEADQQILSALLKDKYQALYQMGMEERPEAASATVQFLFRLSDAFFRQLTDIPDLELLREKAKITLSDDAIESLIEGVPFAIGSEYITLDWLRRQIARLNDVYSDEISKYRGTISLYIAERSQHLRVPERIYFHLVENKDSDYPFAFLATYSTMDDSGTVRHMPLQYALTEFNGKRERLLELLSCLNKAAEVSPLISGFMENGELFHPLRITSDEAYEFLKQIEDIEKTGILCRIPNWWKKKNMAVTLSLKLGDKEPSVLGFEGLVSVLPELEVDGVPLTREEAEDLLAQTEGLSLLKGKWVEVDHNRLKALLENFDSAPESITLLEALKQDDKLFHLADGKTIISNGIWLNAMLTSLRRPATVRNAALPKTFNAQLRPYQRTGYSWLLNMHKLGFGGCLADDMGLGKTIQVLAYLEKLRTKDKKARVLLVVPASLLGNWEKEIEKFTPSMDYNILHGQSSAVLEGCVDENVFLTITTYGMAARIKRLQEIVWTSLILDEAQAIKNPLTKQTKEIKKIKSGMRLAMTGTPVENDLTNLWSLFDFLDKGLLGGSKEFSAFCSTLSERPEGYAKLKSMTSPFLLRRLKTDKTIISDLPDKVEIPEYIGLTKKQIVLYRKIVADIEKALVESTGLQRKGLIIAAITKLKQICNHPDQYLGQHAFAEADSGKFAVLKEICATIRDKRERVLVFTQYKEMTDPLAAFLERIFGAKGYIIHGSVPVAKRTKFVNEFQDEKYVPFMILSVKAGGTGLNLTKANHVIHFDRWWNPAVENQATDRAFRIGQTKNVIVHKMICKGTIEEKIDKMIESKKELAEKVVGDGSEKWLTEMSNEDLISLLRLE